MVSVISGHDLLLQTASVDEHIFSYNLVNLGVIELT